MKHQQKTIQFHGTFHGLKITSWKGEGDCRSVKFVLGTIMGSKNKKIHLQDFKDVDFNFIHFAIFEFAYFEAEESFGLIWVKLQNDRFQL